MHKKTEVTAAIEHLRRHDARLAVLIDQYPAPTFTPHTNYYQELVESIISQQLSVKAAATIGRRFVDTFGHFPEPHEILAHDETDLRAAGLSGQKTRYIRDLAAKVIAGEVQFDHLDGLSNDQIVQELTAVKGIGEWTVHMFLMFCMGRLDVLPTGDLGVRNAVARHYGFDVCTPDDVKTVAKNNNWAPYESVASWYLWQSLDNAPKDAA